MVQHFWWRSLENVKCLTDGTSQTFKISVFWSLLLCKDVVGNPPVFSFASFARLYSVYIPPLWNFICLQKLQLTCKPKVRVIIDGAFSLVVVSNQRDHWLALIFTLPRCPVSCLLHGPAGRSYPGAPGLSRDSLFYYGHAYRQLPCETMRRNVTLLLG